MTTGHRMFASFWALTSICPHKDSGDSPHVEGSQRRRLQDSEEGDVGIGTLVIFIAMVLVAAIAASVLINSADKVRQKAEDAVNLVIEDTGNGFKTVSIMGDRYKDGVDSRIVVESQGLEVDKTPPTSINIVGGGLEELEVSAAVTAGTGNVSITASGGYVQAIDGETGISHYRFYRKAGSTFAASASEGNYIKNIPVSALDTAGDEIYDYISQDRDITYYYGLVAVDFAGNFDENIFLTDSDNSGCDFDLGDEDDTAPTAPGITDINTGAGQITIVWIAGTDPGGSAVKEHRVYRNFYGDFVSLDSSGIPLTADGIKGELVKTVLLGTNSATDCHNTLSGEVYYCVVCIDNAGNPTLSAGSTITSIDAPEMDTTSPEQISNLSALRGERTIRLNWNEAEDNQNGVGIKEYRIYRSGNKKVFKTIDGLKDAEYLGKTSPDITIFTDYTGEGSKLYYGVVAVDFASNRGMVEQKSSIQILEITLALSAGSSTIDMDKTIIEMTDGTKVVVLGLDNSELEDEKFGEYADANSYTLELLRDPDGLFSEGHILGPGALVKLYISTDEDAADFDIEHQSHLIMKFIPKHGSVLTKSIIVPSVMTERYILLS